MSPDMAKSHLSILSEKFPRAYTDDTDMTLALAESIVESGKVDPEDIGERVQSLIIILSLQVVLLP